MKWFEDNYKLIAAAIQVNMRIHGSVSAEYCNRCFWSGKEAKPSESRPLVVLYAPCLGGINCQVVNY